MKLIHKTPKELSNMSDKQRDIHKIILAQQHDQHHEHIKKWIWRFAIAGFIFGIFTVIFTCLTAYTNMASCNGWHSPSFWYPIGHVLGMV
jgi:hypothetical protein